MRRFVPSIILTLALLAPGLGGSSPASSLSGDPHRSDPGPAQAARRMNGIYNMPTFFLSEPCTSTGSWARAARRASSARCLRWV